MDLCLSKDLANERTLLAWIRTGLAVMRTVYATLGIHGSSAWWAAVHLATLAMLVVAMSASAVIGIYRCELRCMCWARHPLTIKQLSGVPMLPVPQILSYCEHTFAQGSSSLLWQESRPCLANHRSVCELHCCGCSCFACQRLREMSRQVRT